MGASCRRPPRAPAEASIPILIHRVASFTRNPAQGNPAGVVLGAGDLGLEAFLRIAAKADATETAFLDRDGPDGWRARYFAPSCEVDFCGHATLAAVGTLARAGELPGLGTTLRTKVGPVRVFRDASRPDKAWMIQQPVALRGSRSLPGSLAAAVGLSENDVAPDLPVTVASTGLWTILLPLRSLGALRRARPTPALAAVGEAEGAGSVHLFTFETDDPLSDVRARNFAFGYGIPEDPVTGSASGALGAFLHAQGRGRPLLTISQGTEVGRPGRALVVVQDDRPHVGGPTAPIDVREVRSVSP